MPIKVKKVPIRCTKKITEASREADLSSSSHDLDSMSDIYTPSVCGGAVAISSSIVYNGRIKERIESGRCNKCGASYKSVTRVS